jgi:hypothetical protein
MCNDIFAVRVRNEIRAAKKVIDNNAHRLLKCQSRPQQNKSIRQLRAFISCNNSL